VAKPTDDKPDGPAQDVLTRLGIKSIPTPVEKIAKLLGAQLRFSPFDAELSGMIYIKEGVPIIGVNSLHHPNRQRFTIGHEIGHLELHKEMITSAVHVDKKFFSGLMRDQTSATGTERIEIEANQFASELLMPRAFVEEVLRAEQFDIDDEEPMETLAKRFRVSRQALEFRIRSLSAR
jgi:Zn-dependent peptidase ImmA (M78 family)